MWQAEYVAQQLEAHGIDAELTPIETIGDKILHKTISKIGSKGVFTEELEAMLQSSEIDIAVHSAKDMQSTLPSGMEIIAFSEREDPHDVVVSYNSDFDFDPSQNLVLGTSSVRRVAFMKYYHPKIRVSDVRGNLQTRMSKMDEGRYDALILAKAGVVRSGMADHIVATLPLENFTPAVGQGSIAVQGSPNLTKEQHEAIRKAVNHQATEYCLVAERAFLKELDGGCSIPAFALATLSSDGAEISITGGIISINGKEILRETLTAPLSQAAKLGQKLARHTLKSGGKEILEEIKLANATAQ
jgi:hydroxymethylbilane synthase